MMTATARQAAPESHEPHVRAAAGHLLSDQPLQQPLRVVRLVEVERRRRPDAWPRSPTVAEALPALGTQVVVFSGGEPLLRPEVFEAAGLFRAHGLSLHLLTSGVLLERCADEVAARSRASSSRSTRRPRPLYHAVRGVRALGWSRRAWRGCAASRPACRSPRARRCTG